MCCVCVFSLRRESPGLILGDKSLISEVVLSQSALSAPPPYRRHLTHLAPPFSLSRSAPQPLCSARLRSHSLVLFEAFACVVVIFWSPWISLNERSRSSFAPAISYVQVKNCFLFPVMPMRVVSGKSKSMRVGLQTWILRLRVLMDNILV
jgi:hypothetical protein